MESWKGVLITCKFPGFQLGVFHMKVNCASGALPLVYPINVEFAYISWFCLQKGNGIIHLDKMGLVLRVFLKISLIASGAHECLCSPAVF